MTTVDLYKKHKKGLVSRESFLYEVRRDSKLPFITNLTSYSDAVQILKNKGIIREESYPEESAYNQGVAAHKAHKHWKNDNPYDAEESAIQHKDWEEGWLDAETKSAIEHDRDQWRRERGGIDEAGGEDYNPEGAWQEGYDAFTNGQHQEENPYEGDTTEHKNWDMGYEKAQHDGPGVNEGTEDFKPYTVKDKNNPNFLQIFIPYPTGDGALTALGQRTMSGQERDSGAQKALQVANDIASKLKAYHNLEDLEVKDLGNGKVSVFAVSDEFIPLNTGTIKEGKELTMDTVNPYEFRKGLTWELGYAVKPSPEWDDSSITNADMEKASKKVLKNLSSNANYYTQLIANKGQKAKKEKEVKVEEDGMAKIKGVEKVSANVQTSLGKKEKGKLRPEGVKEMKGSKKAFSKIKLMKENEMPVLDKKAAFIGKLKEALKTEISSTLKQQISQEKKKLGQLYQKAGQQMANPSSVSDSGDPFSM